MSDSRERFEAHIRRVWNITDDADARFLLQMHDENTYVYTQVKNAWAFWQAGRADGVAETARRCAEIADRIAVDYRAKYKGLPGADGIRRGGSYDTRDDGISDGAALVEDAIRKEFPEAWK